MAHAAPHLECDPWEVINAYTRTPRKIADMLVELLEFLFLGNLLYQQ